VRSALLGSELTGSGARSTRVVNVGSNGYANAVAKAQLATCKDLSANIDIWGLVSFYIAGWDRWPPYGNGSTPPPPGDGIVWGYLVPATPLPSWSVRWGRRVFRN